MLPTVFQTRADVLAFLITTYLNRARQLAKDANLQDKYVHHLKSPEHVEDILKDLQDELPPDSSLSALAGGASMALDVASEELEFQETQSKAIEDQIQGALAFVQLLETADCPKIAAVLREEATDIRAHALSVEERIKPLNVAMGWPKSRYARYHIPQYRLEANFLDLIANLLLIEASPMR
ncbi:MAG: hypothetical protein JWN64_748 [Parcubacteria group bacterium]|nr:hypothetical protein [Parcubacteria group bacterium]